MSVSEVRAELGECVDRAHFGEDFTVITKSGTPRAVLVSYDYYQRHIGSSPDES